MAFATTGNASRSGLIGKGRRQPRQMERGLSYQSLVTHARLLRVLRYDPQSGLFVWLVNHPPMKVGDVAGCAMSHGYIAISVDGCKYLAHRLALFYVLGRWPDGDVDHINGNVSDNRFANLRAISHAANLQNMRRPRADNKTSGMLGVSLDRSRGLWRAQITVRGVNKFIGRFKTKERAYAAYLETKRRLHAGCTL